MTLKAITKMRQRIALINGSKSWPIVISRNVQ